MTRHLLLPALALLPLCTAFAPPTRLRVAPFRARPPIARSLQPWTAPTRAPRLHALRDGREPGLATRAWSAVSTFLTRNGPLFLGTGLAYLLFTGRIFLIFDVLFWGALLLPLATVAFGSIFQVFNSITSECPECGTSLKGQKNTLVRCTNCGSILRADETRYSLLQSSRPTNVDSLFENLFGFGGFGGQGGQGGFSGFGSSGAPGGFSSNMGGQGRQAPRRDPFQDVTSGSGAGSQRPSPKKNSFLEEEEGEVVDVEVKKGQ